MTFWTSLILALGLCADCFAVALCSGVTMNRRGLREVVATALIFSLVHIVFMLAGWYFGSAILGFVRRVASWIGFLLLLLVGGSMFVQGVRGKEEVKLLDSVAHIFMAAAATSVDALAVGAAQSMAGQNFKGIMALAALLFAVTFAVVSTGIAGGKALKKSIGRWAEIAGGLVLIAIGVSVLL